MPDIFYPVLISKYIFQPTIMGFFNLYKPRKYNPRFIYYDPKKEAQKEREKRLAESKENGEGEFKTTIRRGTFREYATRSQDSRRRGANISNMLFFIILFILLALAYYLLK